MQPYVSAFRDEVTVAKAAGEEYIEAEPDLIDFLLGGKSTGPQGYMIYEGIKVFPTGKAEELIALHETSILDAGLSGGGIVERFTKKK